MRYGVFVAQPYTQKKLDHLYWWMHKQMMAGRTVMHPISTATGVTLVADFPESSLLLTEAQ